MFDFFKSSDQILQEQLFNIKFTSKSLVRNSKKCEKNEKAKRKMLAKALKEGNVDIARIYAADALREKGQALNLLRLSSRLDGVAARMNTALTMKQMTKEMAGVVKGMDVALKTMNVEKIGSTMDSFEEKMNELDLVSGVMEGTMAGATATLTPTDTVDDLIQQVADENALEINWQMDTAPTGAVEAPAAEAEQETNANVLEKRLAALRAA